MRGTASLFRDCPRSRRGRTGHAWQGQACPDPCLRCMSPAPSLLTSLRCTGRPCERSPLSALSPAFGAAATAALPCWVTRPAAFSAGICQTQSPSPGSWAAAGTRPRCSAWQPPRSTAQRAQPAPSAGGPASCWLVTPTAACCCWTGRETVWWGAPSGTAGRCSACAGSRLQTLRQRQRQPRRRRQHERQQRRHARQPQLLQPRLLQRAWLGTAALLAVALHRQPQQKAQNQQAGRHASLPATPCPQIHQGRR